MSIAYHDLSRSYRVLKWRGTIVKGQETAALYQRRIRAEGPRA